jgi:mono/diheme cytochrome c family protein
MSRFNFEIFLGVVLVTVTSVIFIVYGLNEPNRMAREAAQQQAQYIEVGASLFEANCSPCHGLKGEGIPGLCPPLNNEEFFTNRMRQVGYPGSLEDYIISTVSAGRLTSTRPDQYAGNTPLGQPAMPAWSEAYGGPLRADQIHDIAQFILNWEATALGEVVLEELPPQPGAPGEEATPITRGFQVFNERGCGGCHAIDGISTGTVGPNLTEVGTIAASRVPDLSAEEYLRQSVLEPNAYVVEGFQPNIMPQNFDELISPEQLDDLVAFLSAQQ